MDVVLFLRLSSLFIDISHFSPNYIDISQSYQLYRYIALFHNYIDTLQIYRLLLTIFFSECDSMGSYPDLIKQHSRNPRMLLNIIHPDAVNEIVAPGYHGKSHMIISLLQDYRHGAPTANSLLVPIGFTIYKVCFNIDICRSIIF